MSIQLLTRGPQDEYLTGKPSTFFFKSVYKQYVDFERITERLYDSELTPRPNFKLKVKIQKKYPFLSQIYIRYNSNTDHNLLEQFTYFSIEVGGQTLQTLTTEFLSINSKIVNKDEDLNIYKNNKYGNCVNITTDSTNNTLYHYYLNIPFFFSNYELSFPLYKIFSQEMYIILHTDKVITDIQNFDLFVEYININENLLKNINYDTMLIEQQQYKELFISKLIDIEFNHPVKELLWCFRSEYKFIYGINNIFNNLSILANNIEISNNESYYYNIIIPNKHHSRTPFDIYVYTFCLYPERIYPTGTLNMSRLNSFQFKFDNISTKSTEFLYTNELYNSNILILNSKFEEYRTSFNSLVNSKSLNFKTVTDTLEYNFIDMLKRFDSQDLYSNILDVMTFDNNNFKSVNSTKTIHNLSNYNDITSTTLCFYNLDVLLNGKIKGSSFSPSGAVNFIEKELSYFTREKLTDGLELVNCSFQIYDIPCSILHIPDFSPYMFKGMLRYEFVNYYDSSIVNILENSLELGRMKVVDGAQTPSTVGYTRKSFLKINNSYNRRPLIQEGISTDFKSGESSHKYAKSQNTQTVNKNYLDTTYFASIILPYFYNEYITIIKKFYKDKEVRLFDHVKFSDIHKVEHELDPTPVSADNFPTKITEFDPTINSGNIFTDYKKPQMYTRKTHIEMKDGKKTTSVVHSYSDTDTTTNNRPYTYPSKNDNVIVTDINTQNDLIRTDIQSNLPPEKKIPDDYNKEKNNRSLVLVEHFKFHDDDGSKIDDPNNNMKISYDIEITDIYDLANKDDSTDGTKTAYEKIFNSSSTKGVIKKHSEGYYYIDIDNSGSVVLSEDEKAEYLYYLLRNIPYTTPSGTKMILNTINFIDLNKAYWINGIDTTVPDTSLDAPNLVYNHISHSFIDNTMQYNYAIINLLKNINIKMGNTYKNDIWNFILCNSINSSLGGELLTVRPTTLLENNTFIIPIENYNQVWNYEISNVTDVESRIEALKSMGRGKNEWKDGDTGTRVNKRIRHDIKDLDPVHTDPNNSIWARYDRMFREFKYLDPKSTPRRDYPLENLQYSDSSYVYNLVLPFNFISNFQKDTKYILVDSNNKFKVSTDNRALTNTLENVSKSITSILYQDFYNMREGFDIQSIYINKYKSIFTGTNKKLFTEMSNLNNIRIPKTIDGVQEIIKGEDFLYLENDTKNTTNLYFANYRLILKGLINYLDEVFLRLKNLTNKNNINDIQSVDNKSLYKQNLKDILIIAKNYNVIKFDDSGRCNLLFRN